MAKQAKATASTAAPAPTWLRISYGAIPVSSASTRKPAASASDTRLEIVMVKRSLAAANAIRAGKNKRRATSRIMRGAARLDQRGQLSLSLSPIGEQSGNEGVRRTLAI